ncbi:MAG TPA: hypothetical protein VFG42_09740 [Baekduia sp.]|uniref:hypothetical protein n=1 Tax=Baekduia sp. TaxID=2600305 RepID=UPI002D766694|nr:hypothetical protein [Baekduia sp.]HET6507061.1 hypothetical protein [Baekduia sp.]
MKAATMSLRRRAQGLYVAAAAAALTGLGAALVLLGPHALVLAKAAGVGGKEHDLSSGTDFKDLIKVANHLTDAAMIPTIAIAPLAAVAGAFALMMGGGGRQGSGGVKLIGGAIGAVVVVAGAKGLAY